MWEYKVLWLKNHEDVNGTLNRYGAAGWRIIYFYYDPHNSRYIIALEHKKN